MTALVAFVKSLLTVAMTLFAASVVSGLTLTLKVVWPAARLKMVTRGVAPKLLPSPVASSTKLAVFPLVSLTTTLITPV